MTFEVAKKCSRCAWSLVSYAPVAHLPCLNQIQLTAVDIRADGIGFQAAAKRMKDGGPIVSVGSVAAVRTGVAGASIQSFTKSALVGIARCGHRLGSSSHYAEQCPVPFNRDR